jgi:hypothetical protein
VKLLTQLDSPYTRGIGLLHLGGMDPGKLGAWLLDKHHIVTTPIVHAEFDGLRITPNVYTTVDEVDLFADRVLDAIRKGMA